MKILALDTTTNNCSVALSLDGNIIEKFAVLPRQHNKNIHKMINDICQENNIALTEIDYLAVTVGPGSFTGVRLGVSVICGLAYGLSIKVIPVSSLAAMAMHAVSQDDIQKVLVGLDARMAEIYWGAYTADNSIGVKSIMPDVLTSPDGVLFSSELGLYAVGEAWSLYKEELPLSFNLPALNLEPNSDPRAYYVAKLASLNTELAVSCMDIEPVYLRHNVTS